jgi:hypothetical protein
VIVAVRSTRVVRMTNSKLKKSPAFILFEHVWPKSQGEAPCDSAETAARFIPV